MKFAYKHGIFLSALLTLSIVGGIYAFAEDQLGWPIDPVSPNSTGSDPIGGSIKLIASVPCYHWYNGCGPTALGMIVGYWDAKGFPNLIPGSNNWYTNQTAIKNMIASPGHITDYVPTPDRQPPPPYHTDDCVADFCKCSRDPLQWGWSYDSYQDDGLAGYANYCGYQQYTVWQKHYSSTLWFEVMSEIDAGHPMEFLVDSNGDGDTDHFVTVIGYDNTQGNMKYACWDTWNTSVRWEDFHAMSSGNAWGVYGSTFFYLVPEPSTFVMLAGLGVMLISRLIRRRHRANR
ncbi:MAG: PEP-CTERM sorting domain-containing protein [Thermoguttaceae bacterium]